MGLSPQHIQFCPISVLQHHPSHLPVKISSADQRLSSSQYYLVLGINCLEMSKLIDLKSVKWVTLHLRAYPVRLHFSPSVGVFHLEATVISPYVSYTTLPMNLSSYIQHL